MTEVSLTWLEKLAESAVPRNSGTGRLRKCAGVYMDMVPRTGDKAIDDIVDLTRNALLRGGLKGAREIIPGFVDGMAGVFGAEDSAKKYISDPMRGYMMRFGGNAVRNLLDRNYREIDRRILDRIGSPMEIRDGEVRKNKEYWDYEKYNTALSALSAANKGLVEMSGSLPLWGRAISLPFQASKWLMRLRKPVAAIRQASNSKPAARTLSNVFQKSIPPMYAAQEGLDEYNARYADLIRRKRSMLVR